VKLILIRHAPTRYSAAGLFMGDKDIPPTREGLEAARQLGRQLASLSDFNLLSSPLSRAFLSASAIFPGKPVRVREELRERGLGDWAGRSKSEIRRLSPQAFLPSGFLDPTFVPPEGEPLDQLQSRIRKFLSEVSLWSSSDCVVAVTHNGVIRLIRHFLESRPLEDTFAESEHYLSPRVYERDGTGWRQLSPDEYIDGIRIDPSL